MAAPVPEVRNPVVNALVFTLKEGFQNYGLDVPVSRRLRPWADVDKQPALFVVQKHEQVKNVGLLFTNKMFFDLVLYVKLDPSQVDMTPADLANPIVDVLFALLAPTPNGEHQLLADVNGVNQAYDVSIDGTIETDEGLLGDQGVVVIPLVVILL